MVAVVGQRRCVERLRWRPQVLQSATGLRRRLVIERPSRGPLQQAAQLRQFPASAAQFLAADGSPPAAGQRLRQPDLGRTLAALADEGPDWFYRGPFAQACADWMSHNGGMLAAKDFAAYTAVTRPPLRTSYHDWQVIGFPPPSSGGIHVAQML